MSTTILKRCAVCCILMTGCSRSEETLVNLRADLVPLKIVMTDYILAESGRKLIKVEGSASYVVPLAAYEPQLEGKCFVYHDLPRPRFNLQSLRIDNQRLLRNERGIFTSRSADSARINKLREEAVMRMREVVERESFVESAMVNAKDALDAFYEKFDGYSCRIQWGK